MTSITIITIVVIALLTAVIFGLTWLGYTSYLRIYRIELGQGKYDTAIIKEYSHKKRGLFGIIWSCLVLVLLSFVLLIGLIYRANDQNIEINGKTILVIKSNSMADFYSDSYAESLQHDRSLQFALGDIGIFETVAGTDLVKGEVYGYKYQNFIIVHRLVKINSDGTYEFRGDNNPTADPYRIKRQSVIYHYTGQKAVGVGALILYAQSYFGLWAMCGISGVIVSSEFVVHKVNRLTKKRYEIIRNKYCEN